MATNNAPNRRDTVLWRALAGEYASTEITICLNPVLGSLPGEIGS